MPNPFVAEVLHGLALAVPTALFTAGAFLWKNRAAAATAAKAAEERADERTIARYNELAEHDRERVKDCLKREAALLTRITAMEKRAEDVHEVHVKEMDRMAREQASDRKECDERAKRIKEGLDEREQRLRDELDELRLKYDWLEDLRLRQEQIGKQTPRGGPQRKPEGT